MLSDKILTTTFVRKPGHRHGHVKYPETLIKAVARDGVWLVMWLVIRHYATTSM